MRKIIFEIFVGKNQKLTAAFIGAFVLFIGLGCTKPDQKAESFPAEFQGVWESENRAILRFKENGKGDLIFMKDNIEMTLEDCLEYNAKEKTVTCENDNPLGRSIKIDDMPKNGEMKLGGVKYYREEDLTKKDKPGHEELQRLVKRTILDLNDGIQDENFEDFYRTLSRRYKGRTSPGDVKKNMRQFIETEWDFKTIKKMDANFWDDTKVYVEAGRSMLKIKGDYDTSPRTIFDFNYIRENNEWKLNEVVNFGIDKENKEKE